MIIYYGQTTITKTKATKKMLMNYNVIYMRAYEMAAMQSRGIYFNIFNAMSQQNKKYYKRMLDIF